MNELRTSGFVVFTAAAGSSALGIAAVVDPVKVAPVLIGVLIALGVFLAISTVVLTVLEVGKQIVSRLEKENALTALEVGGADRLKVERGIG